MVGKYVEHEGYLHVLFPNGAPEGKEVVDDVRFESHQTRLRDDWQGAYLRCPALLELRITIDVVCSQVELVRGGGEGHKEGRHVAERNRVRIYPEDGLKRFRILGNV